MQETKVTLIYFGLSLFVLLALIPWIFNPVLAGKSIQFFCIYGGIVVAFLGGILWGWEGAGNTVSNLWRAIGYSLLGLGVCLLALVHASLSLVLLICSLQFFPRFESKNSTYFQANIKYGNARTLITNLVTICCITLLAYLYNPYS